MSKVSTSNKIKEIDDYFDPKRLNFSFDLSKCHFELDILQEKLLQFYLRSDSKFRRAFSMNYTGEFLQYFKDKVRLREPTTLSVMGNTRSGKSYTSIGLAGIHQALYHRKFSIDYICANKMEFLEKIKNMPEEKTLDRIYLIDEEKDLFGQGSLAKKTRFDNLMGIIAKRNISTINLTPHSFAYQEANYGLRVFGRDFNQKICRLMLYNLQGGQQGTNTPLGCVYLPIFTVLFPKDYAEPLEQDYIKKKDLWIQNEQRTEGDVLYDMKRKVAIQFIKDKQFMNLKKKQERIMFIAQKLGSSWTKGEISEIETLTKMIENGVDFDKE
jgi:hypothetical protein